METYTKLAYPAYKPKEAGLYPTNMGALYWDKASNKGWTRNIGDAFGIKGITYFFSPIEQGDFWANDENMEHAFMAGMGCTGGDLAFEFKRWFRTYQKKLQLKGDTMPLPSPTSLPLLGVKEVDHERLVEIVMKEMLKSRPLSPKLYLTTEEIAESIVTALLKELGLNQTNP